MGRIRREMRRMQSKKSVRGGGSCTAREERGEKLASFAEEGFVEEGLVGGKLGTDVDGLGMGLRVGRETGGGLDGAGCADGQEDRATVEGGKDAIEFEGSFSEPTNVWTDLATAGATGKLSRRFVEGKVFERGKKAGVAATFEKFAVHVEDALRASLFMEIVDVLGAEEEAIRDGLFESGKSEVSGVRFRSGGYPAAHGVKIPNQARITAPGTGRSNIFYTMVVPQPTRIAKSGNTAFGADASTR
jgi:hypothetical protein